MSIELIIASLVILACSALIILLLTSDRFPWVNGHQKVRQKNHPKRSEQPR